MAQTVKAHHPAPKAAVPGVNQAAAVTGPGTESRPAGKSAPATKPAPAAKDAITRNPAAKPPDTRAEIEAVLARARPADQAKPATGKLLTEENRHAAHSAHLKADVAKALVELEREAPHAARALVRVIEANPGLEASIIKSAIDLARMAPDLSAKLFKTITANKLVGKVLLPRLGEIGAVFDKALARTLARHPELGTKAAARIVGESLGRGLAKALPVVGVGLAVWGSKDAVEATLDPKVSRETAGKYWKANALDWGSAIGGLLAETGVGEVAAIAAAVASVFAYADAEASKMKDLGLVPKAH